MLCVKNGTLFTVAQKQEFVGDMLIDGGKIIEIGQNLSGKAEKAGGEVIDATGLYVYPGFVDAHSHLGLAGYAIRFEGSDYNELTDSLTPQLEAIDAFNPLDESVKQAALGGVTTVGTGPGSSNVLGGTFIAVKTVGSRVDDMVIKRKAAMKCAFGENPKFCYKEKDNSSRMSVAAKLRTMINKTRMYVAKKESAGDDLSKLPAYDEKLEALIPVINKEIPLKAHAHRADDIFTALRVAHEMDVLITIEHCTEGHLIAEYLAKENVPLAIGPSFGFPSKVELKNKTFDTPGVLAKAGCKVSIITDAPVIPQQYLPLCAGMAVKSGMDKFEALKAITINPAEHLGVADRLGSLVVGKDADFVITDGCPFELETNILRVFIDGNEVL
ncbi:MAG: amidohydrolase [Treponema sp.]|jgi:imidazolonepropionase-like amidohydrolase|nr:amidohydrolase [Treponema sp.]